MDVNKPYDKGDSPVSDILSVVDSSDTTEGFRFQILSPTCKGEELDKEKALHVILYHRNDFKDKFHFILCIGTEDHYENSEFSKMICPDTMISLDDRHGLGIKEIKNNTSTLDGWSSQFPGEPRIQFCIKDVHNVLHADQFRLFIRGLLDGTFKLPFMAKIID